MTVVVDNPLHEQSPTARFSDRADDYVKYRPSYPPEAIDAVLEGLGEPAAVVAADVGAGTGISARLLSARGVRVIAVEPNREMLGAGIRDATVRERDRPTQHTLPHEHYASTAGWSLRSR